MKKRLILIILVLSSLSVVIGQSEDSDVNINVSQSCDVSIKDYEQPGVGTDKFKIIGKNQTDFFTGTLTNEGNIDANSSLEIKVLLKENGSLIEKNTSLQNGTYFFNNIELPQRSTSINETSFEQFITEFTAIYEAGNYTGKAIANYSCEGDNYTTTRAKDFRIIKGDGLGEGRIPDDVGEENEVDQQLDLDAIIEFLNESASLDTDVNNTENSTPQEGSSDAPGVTPEPEPEPEPEPDPIPLLSITIKPSNSTYEIPKAGSAELGLKVRNVGEEAIENLTIDPRLRDEIGIDLQGRSITDLQVNETANSSIYAEVSETAETGIYQVPVYGSNSDVDDVGMEYFDIRVTDEVTETRLEIAEAPRNINLEQESNYSIPILLENPGTESLNNISFRLEDVQNCGEYKFSNINSIDPDETASTNLRINTSESLQECEGNLVASSENGGLAFAEIQIEIKESVGIFPEQFRVPIVASLWTVMLLAYSVLAKKFDLDNMSVKVPLVLLVIGEAFIIVYLSSAYYGFIPSELLPF